MTTDQNIIQEDQMPDVEVLAAVFPAQPEGPSGDRGWGGEGWGRIPVRDGVEPDDVALRYRRLPVVV